MPDGTPSKTRGARRPNAAATRRRHLWILGIVILLSYATMLPGGFVWTDQRDLLDGGQRIVEWADLGRLWTQTSSQYRLRADGPLALPASGPWQPTVLVDNSLGWALWGDCAFCQRLENLLWHGLVVVGLYALGRHLLSQRHHGNRIAFWAALAFAVHPLGVTAVAWPGGRPVLLGTALAVWALVFLTRLPATSKSHRHHTYRWLGGLGLLFAAAAAARAAVLVAPLVAVLIAWFESAERERPRLLGISGSRRLGLVVLGGVALAFVGYRWLVFGGPGFAGSYPAEHGIDNLGTGLRLFWHYVELVLLPGEPVVSDAWRITQAWSAAEVAALLGAILWLAATAIGLYFRQPAAVGSAWFLFWILPLTGTLPAEYYRAEAALYPAAWGLLFGIAHLLMQLWRPVGRQLARGSEAVMFAPLVFALAFVTALSNLRFWSDSRLFEPEVAEDPHYVEGRALLARVALAEERPADAMNHALNAIEAARDTQFTGYYPRFDVYLRLGWAQLAMELAHEAQGSFQGALEERPGNIHALHGLGRAYLRQGDFAAAEQAFRQALAFREDFAPARADLGVALVGQGRHAEGLELLEQALAAGLVSPARQAAAADAYLAAARWNEAGLLLEGALKQRETARERAKLAWVRWQQGEQQKAREHINIALQLEERSSDYVLDIHRRINGEADAASAARPAADAETTTGP